MYVFEGSKGWKTEHNFYGVPQRQDDNTAGRVESPSQAGERLKGRRGLPRRDKGG